MGFLLLQDASHMPSRQPAESAFKVKCAARPRTDRPCLGGGSPQVFSAEDQRAQCSGLTPAPSSSPLKVPAANVTLKWLSEPQLVASQQDAAPPLALPRGQKLPFRCVALRASARERPSPGSAPWRRALSFPRTGHTFNTVQFVSAPPIVNVRVYIFSSLPFSKRPRKKMSLHLGPVQKLGLDGCSVSFSWPPSFYVPWSLQGLRLHPTHSCVHLASFRLPSVARSSLVFFQSISLRAHKALTDCSPC